MKKKIIFIIFLILLILPLSSAIVFDMKNTFNEEEVLIARLSGDFINPPLKENINFYRGHVRVGIDCSITKIDDDYYLFAPLTGKTPTNYSIVIEDASYRKGTKTIEENIIKNFTIIEGLADFIVDKGFLKTKNNFYIDLENFLDEDLEIIMNISTISGEQGGISNYDEETDYEFTISASKRINFEIDVQKPTTKVIHFASKNTSYEIPISLYRDEQAEASKSYSFEIEPPEMNIIMNITESRIKFIYIYNTGTGTLTGIDVELSDSLEPYVTISENRFGQILPNDNAHFNMTILASGTDGKVISGELYVKTEQKVADSIPIQVETKKGYIASAEELAPQVQGKKLCSEYNGTICTKEEECSETEFYAKDGSCCTGKCNPISEPSSPWKFLGWVLLIIVILIAVWFFFKKYRKVKTPIDLLKVAQGKK